MGRPAKCLYTELNVRGTSDGRRHIAPPRITHHERGTIAERAAMDRMGDGDEVAAAPKHERGSSTRTGKSNRTKCLIHVRDPMIAPSEQPSAEVAQRDRPSAFGYQRLSSKFDLCTWPEVGFARRATVLLQLRDPIKVPDPPPRSFADHVDAVTNHIERILRMLQGGACGGGFLYDRGRPLDDNRVAQRTERDEPACSPGA